jgi:molybdate transport system substrate-binding protein
MRRVAALIVVVVLLASCSASTAEGGTATRTLTVFAASSLTSAFTEAGTAFESAHHDVRVRFSFAGSQTLVAQLKQGAPADVLATADTASMTASGLTGARIFARNRLAIVTAPNNPKHVTRLADLARKDLRVVLAGPTVPVGKAAGKALAAARVTVRPVSLEQDVKGVVTKVRLGEADAGIAYVTDVKAADGAVAGTDLPGISNDYPVAVVKPGGDASAFADFLLSATGRSLLSSYGFLLPS